MNILVFGHSGQVATELRKQGADNVEALDRAAADLSDPQACASIIRARMPDAVINAAAFTAVDRAEQDEAAAAVINGTTPGAMARACTDIAIPFVHISTDYVFAGDGTAPWRPDDACAPQNAYGRTKLAGETAVRSAGGAYAILRTSWVFSAHGNNFLRTMLRLGSERDTLNVVGDQIGGPTPAGAIAATCLSLTSQLAADPNKAGIYHFSGMPNTSWADFAREIMRLSGYSCQINDIPTHEYPTPATRPLNSRMDCQTLEAEFSILRPDWKTEASRIIHELTAAS